MDCIKQTTGRPFSTIYFQSKGHLPGHPQTKKDATPYQIASPGGWRSKEMKGCEMVVGQYVHPEFQWTNF